MKARTIKNLCLIASVMLLSLILLCCGFTVRGTAYAAAETEVVAAETTAEAAEEVTETPTLGTRVQEWFKRNLAEFLSGASLTGIVGTIATIIIAAKKNKKNANSMSVALDNNSLVMTNNTEYNRKTVDAVNELIGKYNEVQEYLKTLDQKELARDELYQKIVFLEKAILEILATVYANNKNIPQGVKDLVTLIYAGARKKDSDAVEIEQATEAPETEEG